MEKYDREKLLEIYEIGRKSIGKTIKEIVGNKDYKATNKGGVGNLLQEYLFGIPINSKSEPDFINLGVELKVIPFKKLKDNTFVPKERMVMNLINFNKIINEYEFNNSSFLLKNKILEVIVYYHDYELDDKLDFKIINAFMFDLSKQREIYIIKKDWIDILQTIRNGRAHNLSEKDTRILGACTKGSTNDSLVMQPNSDFLAMQRAFSLKTAFLKEITRKISKSPNKFFEQIFLNELVEEDFMVDFDGFLDYFKTLKGLDISKYNYENTTSKNWRVTCIRNYLKKNNSKLLKDLKFNNIKLVIKVLNKNNELQEQIGTQYDLNPFEIINEEFEDSTFYQEVILKKYIILGINFFNNQIEKIYTFLFDNRQIENAKIVFKETKKELIKLFKLNLQKKIIPNFIKYKDNLTIHLRPHATTSEQIYKQKNGMQLKITKHTFWINKNEVSEI